MSSKALIPTEEQCDIIVMNISHYFNKKEGDPHQRLAGALDVPRDDAKSLLYSFLYKEDAWFPRVFRSTTAREYAYLNELGLKGEERKAMMDKVDGMAQARENRVFPKKGR